MKTPFLPALVGATLLASACTHNYKSEWKGPTPLRIRNLSGNTVESVKLVPETMHEDSGNWLTMPITPGGEITFTIKDGGYWFKAEGTAGGVKIDTGNSMNSGFGKLLIVKGATEIVLFDRNTPVADTENKQSRFGFSFDTMAVAPGATPPAGSPSPTPSTPPAEPTPPAGSGAGSAAPPS